MLTATHCSPEWRPELLKFVGTRLSASSQAAAAGAIFHIDTQSSPSINITGSSASDTLIGPDLSNAWQIYGTSLILSQ